MFKSQFQKSFWKRIKYQPHGGKRKLMNSEDWNALHKEQVNASRTVQQITANIKEIEKARDKVRDEDLEEFDARVKEVKMKALSSMQEFLPFVAMDEAASSTELGADMDGLRLEGRTGHGDLKIPAGVRQTSGTSRPYKMVPVVSTDVSSQHYGAPFDNVDGEDSTPTPYGSLPATVTTMPAPALNVNLHVVPHNSDASGSWEQLQENIVELNELVHQFASEVEEQGEAIDAIEDHIDSAHENVKEGTKKLAQASKYKSVFLPVVGAVVGGVVAGPLGLLAGAKLGAAAGVVGGTVGFASGRYVKKRQAAINEVEMSNLSDKRSMSLPELQPGTESAEKNGSIDGVREAPAERGMERGSLSHQQQQQQQRPGEEQAEEESMSGDISEVFTSMTSSFKRFFSFSEEESNS
ncbi:syntaxin-17 isoform X2 [Aplysia californica]|uniref:Syntaxin-17 isoform X2 n=1 Tax=Aplysia californica TaxID=6500 RepID=A0ABM1A3A0_APLCA|nr:syntaxin-17 isoform X2 [Aplysia californica]